MEINTLPRLLVPIHHKSASQASSLHTNIEIARLDAFELHPSKLRAVQDLIDTVQQLPHGRQLSSKTISGKDSWRDIILAFFCGGRLFGVAMLTNATVGNDGQPIIGFFAECMFSHVTSQKAHPKADVDHFGTQ